MPLMPAESWLQLLADKTVIALDHQLLDWHKDVDIVLPAASFAEADGTLISAEVVLSASSKFMTTNIIIRNEQYQRRLALVACRIAA